MADQRISGAGDRKRKLNAGKNIKMDSRKKLLTSVNQASMARQFKTFTFILVEGTLAVDDGKYYRPTALK